ncbi:hypothetical protein GCM10022403_085680 [Streptomyces coacervatus]|uniref:Uncharacterized protein n=1 Tax=Streptomyces coacervatus TaxID=647381 RepID=A0ABP7JCA2_9ACTN
MQTTSPLREKEVRPKTSGELRLAAIPVTLAPAEAQWTTFPHVSRLRHDPRRFRADSGVGTYVVIRVLRLEPTE